MPKSVHVQGDVEVDFAVGTHLNRQYGVTIFLNTAVIVFHRVRNDAEVVVEAVTENISCYAAV